jgi:DNA (cytosine-5)-methyltransferase 1
LPRSTSSTEAQRGSTSARTNTKPTVIDLFAGCGGGSIGFKQAGFRVVEAVEIDTDAAEAYTANVGVKPIVRDIRKVKGEELLCGSGLRKGDLTLLFGCPPCQSFTVLRRGLEATPADLERNALVREYLRLVDELLPRHIAFENVPGMKTDRWYYYFDLLLAGLRGLGYVHDSDILDAADFGVPQHRRRLLVIASRTTEPLMPKPTYSGDPEEGLRPHRTVRNVIGQMPVLKAGEADPDDPFHAARHHRDIAIQRLCALTEGQARNDLPAHLQLACHQGHNGHYDIYGRMWWDRPAPTLTSGCTNVTRGRFGHPVQNRAITLREAMLLQELPKYAVLVGKGDVMALQVGNAVPPRITKRIGFCIAKMDRSTTDHVAPERLEFSA